MKTVGFDIGGTQLRAAIFDEARNMTDSYRTENDKGITAAFNMDKLIDFILSKPYQYKRIVIGCPGTMDIRSELYPSSPSDKRVQKSDWLGWI